MIENSVGICSTTKPSPADKPGRKRYNMKKRKISMRIIEETREDLDRINE